MAGKRLPERIDECAWEQALHASKFARLQLYRAKLLEPKAYDPCVVQKLSSKELKRLVRLELDRDPALAFIADLDQAPGFMQAKRSLPTLISHFSLRSLRAGRPLLGNEAFLTQGLPMVDGIASWSVSCRYLRSCSEVIKQELSGNTINLQVLMSLMAFIGRVAQPRCHVQLQHELHDEVELKDEDGSHKTAKSAAKKRKR